MLPPHLTRHYWETRRTHLQSVGAPAGFPTTPWFQLTPTERLVAEQEMELFRQAIRAAEEEQDLLKALTPQKAAADTNTAPSPDEERAKKAQPEPVVAVVSWTQGPPGRRATHALVLRPRSASTEPGKVPSPDECGCSGCSAVAAVLKLTGNGSLFQQRARPVTADEKTFGTGPRETAAASPKPMTFVEALAKWGWPEEASDMGGPRGVFSGPVTFGFDVPSPALEELRRKAQESMATNLYRSSLLRPVIT
ncbi:hypothetical protein [Streptomyces rubiginosohelvolus]|uniref:hypothetical protein n=1 Tax=Streptomyces rubiginosohelvolus TaxID=67362 RepID=UPI0035DF742A